MPRTLPRSPVLRGLAVKDVAGLPAEDRRFVGGLYIKVRRLWKRGRSVALAAPAAVPRGGGAGRVRGARTLWTACEYTHTHHTHAHR